MTPRKSNVDGGYAWVVAGALFLMDLQIGMMWTIIGLLTPAIIREIGEDITMTSLVGSTFLGTTTLFGPASGLLQDKLGHRWTGMVSGVLMLIGLTSASFCKSVTGLILTFGFVTGLGSSLALNVSGVAPGSYFVKKLSVAYGLIQVGGGCGMCIVGPLTIFLLDQYNLSGTLLILGGIMFHMTLAGALIRPNNVTEDKEIDIEVVIDSNASSANGTIGEVGLHSQNTKSEDKEIDIEVVTDSYASSINGTISEVGLHSQNTKSEDRGIDNEVVTDSKCASSANGTIGEVGLQSQNTKSEDKEIDNEVVTDSKCASSANGTIGEVSLQFQNTNSEDRGIDNEVVTDSKFASSANGTIGEVGLHSQNTKSENKEIDIEVVNDSKCASSINGTIGEVGLHSQNTKSEDKEIDNEVVTDSCASSANGTIGEVGLQSQNTDSENRGIDNEVVTDSYAASINGTIGEVGLQSQNTDSEDKEIDIEVVTDSCESSINGTIGEVGLQSQNTDSEDKEIDIEVVTDSCASINGTIGEVGLQSQNTDSEDKEIDIEVVTDSCASINGTIGEVGLQSQNTDSEDKEIDIEVVTDSCASSINWTIGEVGLQSQNTDSESVVSAEDPRASVPEDLNHSDDTERTSFEDVLYPNCSVNECIALHITATGESLITNHKFVIEEIEKPEVKEQSSKGKINPTFTILVDSVNEENCSSVQISDDKESNFSKAVVNPSFSTSSDSLNEESENCTKDTGCIFMTNASCKICSEVGNELHELSKRCEVSCGEVNVVEMSQNNEKDGNLFTWQAQESNAAGAHTGPRNVENREVLTRTKSIDKENIKLNCNIFKNTLLNNILQVIKGNGFFIYLLSSVFWTLGDSSCMLHLPNYAESKGTTPIQTSTFLVCQGVSTIFSSFLSGFVVSDPAIGNTLINFGSLGMAGLVTILFPLYSNSYLFQSVYISLYGFYSQTSYTMVGPHCIQLVGTANLGLGFGLASFVTGLGFLFGPPIASLLYEVSGVYDYSFIFAGFCLLASAFLLALIPMFEKQPQKVK